MPIDYFKIISFKCIAMSNFGVDDNQLKISLSDVTSASCMVCKESK